MPPHAPSCGGRTTALGWGQSEHWPNATSPPLPLPAEWRGFSLHGFFFCVQFWLVSPACWFSDKNPTAFAPKPIQTRGPAWMAVTSLIIFFAATCHSDINDGRCGSYCSSPVGYTACHFFFGVFHRHATVNHSVRETISRGFVLFLLLCFAFFNAKKGHLAPVGSLAPFVPVVLRSVILNK